MAFGEFAGCRGLHLVMFSNVGPFAQVSCERGTGPVPGVWEAASCDHFPQWTFLWKAQIKDGRLALIKRNY